MKRIIPSIAACVAMGVCLYVSYVPGNTTEKYKKEESMYSRTWINQSAEDVKKNIQKEAAKETEIETQKEADKETGVDAAVETETKAATEEKKKESTTEKAVAMTETPQTEVRETEAKQTETQAPETEAKQTETQAPETEIKQPETQAPPQIKKYGKENDVRNVQYMLSLRGYDVSHTGKMNRETKSAIKEYRKEKGLTDGDYIDDELLEALGIRNANTIKEIQTKLSDIGYSVGTPDGLIGRKTQDAIESYKADKDLGNGSEINDDVLKALGIIRETAKAEEKTEGETKETGERVLTPNFKKDITDLPEKSQEKFIAFDEWLSDNLNTDKLKEGNKTDEEKYPYIIKQVLDACYDIVKDDDPDNKAEISKKFQTLISYDNDKFNVAKFSDGEITKLYEAAYEAVS